MSEHRSYRFSLYASVILVSVIFWGFGLFAYFKGAPKHFPFVLHLHAWSMAGWCLSVVAQAWFAWRGELRWHKRLGFVSTGLILCIFVSTLLTIHWTIHRGQPVNSISEIVSRWWIPGTDLLLFTTCSIAAFIFRKRAEAHRRLMLSSLAALLPPALARIHIICFPEFHFLNPFQTASLGLDVALGILAVLDHPNSKSRLTTLKSPYVLVLTAAIIIQLSRWLVLT